MNTKDTKKTSAGTRRFIDIDKFTFFSEKNGEELLLGRLYDEIGFGRIKNRMLRRLVLARAGQNPDKPSDIHYLDYCLEDDERRIVYDDEYEEYEALFKIHIRMDILPDTKTLEACKICAEHTKRVESGVTGTAFCYVTVLEYASKNSDFPPEYCSSDGNLKKGKKTRMLLCLVVSASGTPISYSLREFEGNNFPVISKTVLSAGRIAGLGKNFVVVADSCLLDKADAGLWDRKGFKYVIPLRKEETEAVLAEKRPEKGDGEDFFREYVSDGGRIILEHTRLKAAEDARKRETGLNRLRKKLEKLNAGCPNPGADDGFLEKGEDGKYRINEGKIAVESALDGYEGYITNADVGTRELLDGIHGYKPVIDLFRVSYGRKYGLQRPYLSTSALPEMFNFSPRRARTHIGVCFMALKIYRELGRLLRLEGINAGIGDAVQAAADAMTVGMPVSDDGDIMYQTVLPEKYKIFSPLFPEKTIVPGKR